MIIRPNNMTPEEVQKQIASTAKMKRGFNQTPKDISDNFNLNQAMAKGNQNNKPDMSLNKKIQAMKNVSKFK